MKEPSLKAYRPLILASFPLKTKALARTSLICAALQVLGIAVFSQERIYTPYTFTIFAGGGVPSADGKGRAAGFVQPNGLTTDAADNVYVADQYTVRKITPDAIVTTVVNGAFGSSTPRGVAVTGDGTIYVAFSSDGIFKVSPDGQAQRLFRYDFDWPWGAAVDSAGNVYISDIGSRLIRQITPDGVLLTLAGGRSGFTDGFRTEARFYSPNCIQLDSLGNAYIGDYMVIRKLAPDGWVTTFAGSTQFQGPVDGMLQEARFSAITGIAIDKAGNIFVADHLLIRRIDPQGLVTTLGSGGAMVFANFGGPAGVAVDSTGNLYVSVNNFVWKGIPTVMLEPPVRLGNSEVQVRFNTTLHTQYTVLASADLSDWATIGTVAGTGSKVSFVDTNAVAPQRFYSVRPQLEY
jgi:sugar lactone lactonase YvrE